ncbi:MAG: recombinase family protein [Pseudomonadota bacterium]
MKTVRCAIYTRKSSDEGLEQGFNSLDAQREACAAYILSQASEDWTALPDIYDDGGISGGTLERPALQRLLADVAAGHVDIIVVYKVDRLTRSLLDFSKLVEAFDKAGTSFVSITQSFNTTTSMGRLTLNMLLSFAQFEREVTAERIRDKIAASKAKGMWMGGTPPLGYRPDGRTLAIVEEQAALVREIFALYLQLGNVRLVTGQLLRQGGRSPIRTRTNGTTFGGCHFTRGQLYAILRNPIYIGEIAHGAKRYKGQHPAIIERDTWERVQALLAEHVQGRRAGTEARPSILAGRIVDERGQPLIATHACKGNKRYRYYVSRDGHHGTGTAPPLRVPAGEIEALVREQVAAKFDDPVGLITWAGLTLTSALVATIDERCKAIAATLRSKSNAELIELLTQVRVGKGGVEIDLAVPTIAKLLDAEINSESAIVTLRSDARLTRTGMVVRLVQANGQAATPMPPDAALLRLLVQARKWWAVLRDGEINITALAEREGVTSSWLTRVLRLAFLSPAMVEAIVNGTLPPRFDALAMIRPGAVSATWREQDAQYRG